MKILIRPRSRGPGLIVSIFQAIAVLAAFSVALYIFISHASFEGALACSGFGFLILLASTYLRFRPAPVILIDQRGIIDRRTQWGLIRWEDLIDAQIEPRGLFLCLRLENPDQYLTRLPAELQKKMQFHQSLGFRMINLEIKELNVNALDLLSKVRREISDRRRRPIR